MPTFHSHTRSLMLLFFLLAGVALLSAQSLILEVSGALPECDPLDGTYSFSPGEVVHYTAPESLVYEGNRLYCMGIRGTGSVPGADWRPSGTFRITQASTLTWVWASTRPGPGFYITTNDSLHLSDAPASGRTFTHDSLIVIRIPSQVDLAPGVRLRPGRWTVEGATPSSGADTLLVLHPTGAWVNVTWEYIIEYAVTIETPMGDPMPVPGVHWWAGGPWHWEFYLRENPIMVDGALYYSTGYMVRTASGDVLPGLPAILDQSLTVTWLWQTDPANVTLTVISEVGASEPAVGAHEYIVGDTVTAWVDSMVAVDGDTLFCTGWEGTGSIPGWGTVPHVTFVIHQPTTITWLWTQPVRCTLYVDAPVGWPVVPAVGTHLFRCGEVVSFAADLAPPAGLVHCPDGRQIALGSWCAGYILAGAAGNRISSARSDTVRVSGTTWLSWTINDVPPAVAVSFESDPIVEDLPIGTHYLAQYDTFEVTVPALHWDYSGPAWKSLGATVVGGEVLASDSVHLAVRVLPCDTLVRINWSWSPAPLCTLEIVTPERTTCNPPAGIHWVPCGYPIPITPETLFVGEAHDFCGNPYPWSHRLIGWTLNGVPQDTTGFILPLQVTITGTTRLEFLYSQPPTRPMLTVASPYGAPLPPVGTRPVDAGIPTTLWVNPSWWLDSATLMICSGWRGTGDVPAIGTANQVTYTACLPQSTIEWQWSPAPICTLRFARTIGWEVTPEPLHRARNWATYFSGTDVTVRLLDPPLRWAHCGGDSVPMIPAFQDWIGRGVLASPTIPHTNPFGFRLTGAAAIDSVVWSFTPPNARVTVLNSRGGTPGEGLNFLPYGSTLTFWQPETVFVEDLWWRSAGWTGDGIIPPTGDSVRFTLRICDTTQSLLTWHWDSIRSDVTPFFPAEGAVRVYPNPTGGAFRLEVPPACLPRTVLVTDILGREMSRHLLVAPVTEFRLTEPGIYMLRIERWTSRIVVK